MAEFLSSDPGVLEAHPNTVYDLIANICHDGQAGSGKETYRVHVRHKVTIVAALNSSQMFHYYMYMCMYVYFYMYKRQ